MSGRVGPGNSAGRRERDRHGRVVRKDHDPGGQEPEPRRDASGRRLRDSRGRVLDKAGDPERQRRRT